MSCATGECHHPGGASKCPLCRFVGRSPFDIQQALRNEWKRAHGFIYHDAQPRKVTASTSHQPALKSKTPARRRRSK